MDNWVVGVDLGATKIALGLIDPSDRIVAYGRVPTGADDGPQAVVERIAQGTAELERELPDGKRIAAVGVCCPGPMDHRTGRLMEPPNLQRLHHTPLGQMLAERLELPVSLEHDAKAAALGEFYYGAGRVETSMIYIVVGTGVGAAVIADGQLYRGAHNIAGELGHITLDRHGDLCSCGSRGCVETHMSGPWLARHYQRALQQAGRDYKRPVSGEQVARLAEEGDESAVQVMTEAGEALGVAVASLAMLLDISLYVVGGSVARSGALLLEPARKIVPQYSYESVSSRVRIVATELHEDGPILGCGWQARQALRHSAPKSGTT
jgi:glucokinase